MITLHHLYLLAGATFAAFALLSLPDRANRKRLGNAAFWGLVAASFRLRLASPSKLLMLMSFSQAR